MPAGLAAIGVAMLRRNLIREAPWFFTYIVFHVLDFFALFGLYHYSYRAYFYSYWVSELVDALLVLAVIQELFDKTLEPFDALRRISRTVFYSATIALMVAIVLLALRSHGTESDRLIASLLIVCRSASFVQCGLIFLLALVNWGLGVPFSRLHRGIAAGLGVYAAAVSGAMTIRAYLDRSSDPVFSLAQTLCYDVALVIWFAAALLPEKAPASNVLGSPEALHKWNTALLGSRNR